MKASFEAMAKRADNAFNRLVECLAEHGGLDHDTAVKVANFYLANKLAKIDYGVGQFKLQHGAYLDADVIARAAMMADES